jgi:hypothetical protein
MITSNAIIHSRFLPSLYIECQPTASGTERQYSGLLNLGKVIFSEIRNKEVSAAKDLKEYQAGWRRKAPCHSAPVRTCIGWRIFHCSFSH